jgi:hypothetical protein
MSAALAAVVAVASVVVAEPRLPLAAVALPVLVQPQALVEPLLSQPLADLPVLAELRVRARRPVEDAAVSAAVPVQLLLSRRSHSAAMARKPS